MPQAELPRVVSAVASASPSVKRRELRSIKGIRRHRAVNGGARGIAISRRPTSHHARDVGLLESGGFVPRIFAEQVVHGLGSRYVGGSRSEARRTKANGRSSNLRRRRTGRARVHILPVRNRLHTLNRDACVVLSGQRLRRLEIAGLALGVKDIGRFGEIFFLQQAVREAAHIGCLENKAVGQFTRDGEIDHVRIRSFEFVIQTVVDGESAVGNAQRRRNWKWAHGRRFDDGAIFRASPRRRLTDGRNRIQSGVARRSVHGLDAGRIGNGGGQTEGSVAIKSVGDAFAEMVEVKSVTGANGCLAGTAQNPLAPATVAGRRIGECEPGSDIFVIPGPIRLLTVCLSGEGETNHRIVYLAVQHGLRA